MSRAAIVELLHAGMSNTAIAQRLHIRTTSVSPIRQELGLPQVKGGFKPATSHEDVFWRRAQPTDGGHLLWPYSSIGPRVGNRRISAYRIAFRIGNGRDPVGYVRTGCDQPGCVHPAHVEDQPMRDQYAAIFGH